MILNYQWKNIQNTCSQPNLNVLIVHDMLNGITFHYMVFRLLRIPSLIVITYIYHIEVVEGKDLCFQVGFKLNHILLFEYSQWDGLQQCPSNSVLGTYYIYTLPILNMKCIYANILICKLITGIYDYCKEIFSEIVPTNIINFLYRYTDKMYKLSVGKNREICHNNIISKIY